ncbi:hypothetical protein GCM10014715_79250 [Streptomyces spiralis]|uniref:Uncharacterized protein n=1 Tax=Streptomyces spiralis TaxID=66376 RepID=A0A919E4C3_9ACTN|nr:hypothetical protein GCM10014715_79250 [Streptomyces spiralis]
MEGRTRLLTQWDGSLRGERLSSRRSGELALLVFMVLTPVFAHVGSVPSGLLGPQPAALPPYLPVTPMPR